MYLPLFKLFLLVLNGLNNNALRLRTWKMNAAVEYAVLQCR